MIWTHTQGQEPEPQLKSGSRQTSQEKEKAPGGGQESWIPVPALPRGTTKSHPSGLFPSLSKGEADLEPFGPLVFKQLTLLESL